MAAPFGKILVFDLDGAGAGAFQQPHGALDVERVAVTGVGIDDQMHADPVADERDRLHHLAHADETDVRPPEPGIGDAGAGDVQRFEARALGDERGQRVIHTGRHQDRSACKTFRQGDVGHGHSPR